MDRLLNSGRWLFAIPTILFGAQYLQFGSYQGGLPPVPPWAPGGAAGAYGMGVLLVVLGLLMLIGRQARLAATVYGLLFLVCVIFLQCQKLRDVVFDGTARTRALEPLALAGAAFVLAGQLREQKSTVKGWESFTDGLAVAGRYIFAFTLVIFGAQHFEFAQFIATLIPAWIPGHLFFAYFTGVAMIAAGLAITFGILGRLGSTLIGIMFLSWFVVLHTPRVLAQPHNGDELTSAFIALGMGGASFIVAQIFSEKK